MKQPPAFLRSAAFISLTSLGLPLGCKPSSSITQAAGGSGSVSIHDKDVNNCPGGRLRVVTASASSLGSALVVSVVSGAPKHVRKKMSDGDPQNNRTLAMINGGYFDESSGTLYSYFRSPREGAAAQRASAIAKRTCGLFVPAGANPKIRYEQEGSTEYQRLIGLAGTEVFCAGPRLLRQGNNVVSQASCDEKFRRDCRTDKSDPIDLEKNLPRSGSCTTQAGDFKLFLLASGIPTIPNGQCGGSVNALAEAMRAEGCWEGMAHDGGSSSALFSRPNTQTRGEFLTGPGMFNRAVPVYVRISEP